MDRIDVRSHIPSPFEPFSRDSTDKSRSDHFTSAGIFAYYTQYGKLEAIEFCGPAEPLLFGAPLLGSGFSEAKAVLESHGGELEEDDAGATSYSLGIGLYAPGKNDSRMDPVEAVIVFSPGYYN